MSIRVAESKYRCWNDCVPQGCPGHTAKITYQSVSDSLQLEDGRGREFFIQTPELEAFYKCLKQLGLQSEESE